MTSVRKKWICAELEITLKMALLIRNTMYNCFPGWLNSCFSYTLHIFHILCLLISCITMNLGGYLYPNLSCNYQVQIRHHLEDERARHFIGMEKRLRYRGNEGKWLKIMCLQSVYRWENFAIFPCNPTQSHDICQLEHASIRGKIKSVYILR